MNERKWLEYVNPDLIDLFPLQFANCDRLQEHDALFIFDEVGSGKTITSGLMALDFIEKNGKENNDVLVITTKALADGEQYGQFLGDWYTMLPFKDMRFTENIHIINNHYIHIEKHIGKKYGLIIIDEAHLFLRENTKKHLALAELQAEKVVFLTATPIKNDEDDLQIYVNLAASITKKSISNKWIEEIETLGKQKEELVCANFDISSPVTRYFKDTIQSLLTEKGKSEKKFLKRHETLLHGIQIAAGTNGKERDQLKAKQTIHFINDRLQRHPDARFVIFTRFIEKEADVLRHALIEENYSYFDIEKNERSYAVVTGKNNNELTDYSNKSKNKVLPTVLVLSYQIAEQGVNLPGYNHVINYHIPAFPSAIEQRYGRIDRLSKDEDNYKAIYNCFILPTDYYDSNRSNFYTAISISLNNLLKYLPSRNTLLSKTLLNHYLSEATLQRRQLELFQEALKNELQLKLLYELTKDGSDMPEQLDQHLELLFTLYEKLEDFDFSEEPDNFDTFTKALKDALDDTISSISVKGTKMAETLLQNKDYVDETEIWDNIFYRFSADTKENLQDINAIKEAARFIMCNNDYNLYKERFEKELAPNYRFNQYKEVLDYFFYKVFSANQFNLLFPICDNKSYEKVIHDCKDTIMALSKNEFNKTLTEDDMTIILANINRWASQLPIFVFFEEFRRLVGDISITEKGSKDQLCTRQKYGSPFSEALIGLWDIKNPSYPKIQDEIELNYKNDNELWDLLIFQRKEYKESELVEASKYLKLLYHFSRKEFCSFGETHDEYKPYQYLGIFKELENIKTHIVNHIYQSDVPKNAQDYFEENLYKEIPNSIIEQIENNTIKNLLIMYNGIVKGHYEKLLEKQNDIKNYMSMFMNFVFSVTPRSTGVRHYRNWVEKYYIHRICLPRDYYYYSKDYWTINIIYELFGVKLDSKFIVDTTIQKMYTKRF